MSTDAWAHDAADEHTKSIECQQNAASASNLNIVRKHSKLNGLQSSRQGGQQGSTWDTKEVLAIDV